ncbi:MAG: hypothetical protein ACREX0_09000 [Noviherbaspirillum sp.]
MMTTPIHDDKGISTYRFVLRWYGVPFFLGIAMALAAAYGLMTYESAAVNPVIGSAASLASRPVYVAGLLLGIVIAAKAWRDGAKLKGGRP